MSAIIKNFLLFIVKTVFLFPFMFIGIICIFCVIGFFTDMKLSKEIMYYILLPLSVVASPSFIAMTEELLNMKL